MTTANLMKTAESSPNGLKTLWEKVKLLVMSNFSFSLGVFKRLVLQAYKKWACLGNVYKKTTPLSLYIPYSLHNGYLSTQYTQLNKF